MENAVTADPRREDEAEQPRPPNVLNLVELRNTRQPQLTDAELSRIRMMIDQFDMIIAGCPIARRALAP